LGPDEVIEFFSIYLILPAALGPGVYSASNRIEYQKQKNVSVVPNKQMILRVMVFMGVLRLNVGGWEVGFVHIPIALFVVEVHVPICEQNNISLVHPEEGNSRFV
jgi:hypothetical protein